MPLLAKFIDMRGTVVVEIVLSLRGRSLVRLSLGAFDLIHYFFHSVFITGVLLCFPFVVCFHVFCNLFHSFFISRDILYVIFVYFHFIVSFVVFSVFPIVFDSNI